MSTSCTIPSPPASFDERIYQRVEAYLDQSLAKARQVPVPRSRRVALTTSESAWEIYARMTSHRFCRRKPDDTDSFLLILEAAVRRHEPISCILGHGPLKNPNNCPDPRPDWAEYFAYLQLLRLATAVRKIHEPGIRVTLYLDDARAEAANGVSADQTDAYRQCVDTLIRHPIFKTLFDETVSLRALYRICRHENHLDRAEALVTGWKADPANVEHLTLCRDHAGRNLPAIADEPPEAFERRVQEAVHRYLVYYEAEKLCDIWSRPDRLYMRYSPHAGFYQIYTLRKGSVSQPWQGQGVLRLTDGGKLDPAILTRQKAEKSRVLYRFTPAADDPRPFPITSALPVVADKPDPPL